jgi:hypothetical protein
MTCGPRAHSSPGRPAPASRPVSGSTTRSSVPGMTRPTDPGGVPVRRSGIVMPTAVSVSP